MTLFIPKMKQQLHDFLSVLMLLFFQWGQCGPAFLLLSWLVHHIKLTKLFTQFLRIECRHFQACFENNLLLLVQDVSSDY